MRVSWKINFKLTWISISVHFLRLSVKSINHSALAISVLMSIMHNLCAELILIGQKVATCSLNVWYESGEEQMPAIGHLQVVVDWNGKPICIIETDSVEMCKYSDVTAEFAYAEGEGDRSLEWWQKTHWDYFAKECEELSIRPNESMMLVLERFHVVYGK